MTTSHSGPAQHYTVERRPANQRDLRIDFFRGLALIFIFIDHLPNSKLSIFTMQGFAFADAAEVFFFLSGFVAALVYGSSLQRDGFFCAMKRIYRRAWVIYAAQMILFALLTLIVALGAMETGHSWYQDYFRTAMLYRQPTAATLGALTLRFQPVYMDILPLYVVFLGAFPMVLAALKRNLWLAIIPSAALYGAVQIWGWNPKTYPDGYGWFFNPLAWQFIFVLGAALGTARAQGKHILPNSGRVTAIALALATSVASIKFGIVKPPMGDFIAAWSDKSSMAPLRLVSFFALLVTVRQFAPSGGTLNRLWPSAQLIRCGQFSLQIFCLGILVAIIGRIGLTETGNSLHGQLFVMAVGLAAMCGFAAFLENRRKEVRAIRAALAAKGAEN